MGLRSIQTDGYSKIVPPSAFGKPARLEWLAIKQLVIDPDYQREISTAGRTNVRRIAQAFNWSMFTPVIVAAAGGNKYAIVDGQHRTTAAALCGLEKVPCAIIEAKRNEQAAAFKAINGAITRLSSIQLHHASVMAGDKRARHAQRVCEEAGVVILRYPKDIRSIAPRETMAVGAIQRALDKHGEEPLLAALGAINAAGGGYSGNLRGPVISVFAEILAEQKQWRGAKLRSAVDEIYPDEMLLQAKAKATRTPGQTAGVHLKAALVAALTAKLRGKAA